MHGIGAAAPEIEGADALINQFERQTMAIVPITSIQNEAIRALPQVPFCALCVFCGYEKKFGPQNTLNARNRRCRAGD